MNNMSNKMLVWLAGMLIGGIVVLAVLIENAKQISSHMVYIELMVAALALLGLLYAAYQVWHGMNTRHLERKQVREAIRRENELLQHQKHIDTQTLMNSHDLELERIRLEHAKLRLEHTKLAMEAQLSQWRVLVPEGHTVVFPADGYQTIASPRQAKQLATGASHREEEQALANPGLSLALPEAHDFAQMLLTG